VSTLSDLYVLFGADLSIVITASTIHMPYDWKEIRLILCFIAVADGVHCTVQYIEAESKIWIVSEYEIFYQCGLVYTVNKN
jgi:hypothetical protein